MTTEPTTSDVDEAPDYRKIVRYMTAIGLGVMDDNEIHELVEIARSVDGGASSRVGTDR